MAITKINADAMDLTDAYAFTGAVTGARLQPALRLTQTVAQTIATGTETVMDWNNTVLDTASGFNATNNRWIPNVAGWYFVLMMASCHDVSNGTAQYPRIRKNGTSFAQTYQNNPVATGQTRMVAGIIDMNGSSDYIDGTITHSHGSNRNTWADAQLQNLSAFYLGNVS